MLGRVMKNNSVCWVTQKSGMGFHRFDEDTAFTFNAKVDV